MSHSAWNPSPAFETDDVGARQKHPGSGQRSVTKSTTKSVTHFLQTTTTTMNITAHPLWTQGSGSRISRSITAIQATITAWSKSRACIARTSTEERNTPRHKDCYTKSRPNLGIRTGTGPSRQDFPASCLPLHCLCSGQCRRSSKQSICPFSSGSSAS